MGKLLNSVLPYTCLLCDVKAQRLQSLCHGCEKDLPWLEKACMRCGLPLMPRETLVICGKCLREPPPFHATIALFHYQAPINFLITGLKFHRKLTYAKILSELMFQRLSEFYRHQPRPQLILPVPLHKTRLRERGFNQALELARPIARRLQIPLDFRLCQRKVATQPQSSIPAKLRRANMKNAFSVNPKLQAGHVLIIDDVMTTGYTLKEFCKTLQKAGVKKIDVCCAARTLPGA